MRYVTATQGKCDSIFIGRQGENKVVTVQFDVSGWQEMYGSGSFSLLHQRSADMSAYPCVITSDTNTVSWVITSTDVFYVGNGKAQLLYIVNDAIAKSVVFTTVTRQSLNAGDAPDPEPEWIADVVNAGLDAEAYAVGTRNGNPVDEEDPTYHNNAKWYAEQPIDKIYWVENTEASIRGIGDALNNGCLPVAPYSFIQDGTTFTGNAYYIKTRTSGGTTYYDFQDFSYNIHYRITITYTVTENTYGSINAAIELTEDDLTESSTKLITSGGVYDALLDKADKTVEDTLKTVTNITPVFTQGTIIATTGIPTSNSARCRGDAYYVIGAKTTIIIPNAYRYALYFSNSESVDDYIGSTYTDEGWAEGNRTITANDGKYFRIVVVWQDTTSAITPSDITGVTFQTTAFTDRTLTEIGKAADAKSVGDLFNNSLTLRSGITANSDLNDYLTAGIYGCTSATAATLTNCPTVTAFTLLVFGGNIKRQVLITSITIYYRSGSNGEFTTAWYSLPRRYQTVVDGGAIATGTDFNDETLNRFGILASSRTYVNAPYSTGYSGTFFNIIPNATPTYETPSSATQIISYSTGEIFVRSKISTGWLVWRKILTEENIDKQLVNFVNKGLQITKIISTQNKWSNISSTSQSTAFIFEIPNGVKKVSMIAQKGAVIAFLQTWDDTVDVAGTVPNFDKRYTSRIYLADAGRVEYRISDDTRYMYILGTSSTGVDLKPTEIYYHYTFVPEKLQELPVLYLTGDTSEMTKENAVTLNYWLFGNTGTCTVKWQGSSSQRYVKKNYTIKFDTGFDGWNKWATFVNDLHAKNGNISTIPTTSRWGSRTKYCAKANWIDPSAARNIVCARLWGQIVKDRITDGDVTDGRTDAPNYGAVDGFPIEIVINNESTGLYTLNIPKDSWQFAMGSGTSECFLSAESNSVNACKWKALAEVDETDYSVEYASDGFETADIKASLNTAIQAALNAGANWETDLAPYLDIDSVIDYFIFACCFNGTDIMAHNIIYGTYDGTKWFMSAYDLDTTFGVDPYGTKWMDVKNDRCQFAEVADFHRLAYLMYNHSKAKLKARYQELRSTILSEANVWKELSNFIVDIPTYDYDVDRQIWTTTPGTSLANISQYMEFYRMHCAYLDAEIEAL